MIRIIESINDKEKTVTITVNDITGDFVKLINDIKQTASMGHTFDVVVDPTDENPRTYEIDGDGSFRITEINEEDNIEKEEKKESI